MQACPHRRFECIQVSYRNIHKCITNFNRLTTVAHVIDALLDDLCEDKYLTTSDCCLYVERSPYLFPLKPTDFVQDVLLRYASSDIRFKLSFKRNSSPSRFAQRKKLLRTPVSTQPTITNAYEQLKIQELLIRKQQEIITQLKKTTHCPQTQPSNYENYFDWVVRNDEDSDNDRISSDSIPVCGRQSRQDEYLQAVNRETTNTSRSLSRVRFRPSTEINSEQSFKSSAQMKSILKNNAANSSEHHRNSSVDRDITRLLAVKQRRNSLYVCDDADDEDLSDRSTTDSCLGSLSSEDNNSYIINQHQLETLV